ncbi:MAG: glycosyltransferase [Polyangia bacterium]
MAARANTDYPLLSRGSVGTAGRRVVPLGERPPLRVVDFNNTFSFSGGGVRTYHLEKLEHLGKRSDVEYTLVVPSDRDGVERRGRSRLMHLRAPRVPGAKNYRLLLNPFKLASVIEEIRPDLIEVGGPYVDPLLIRHAARKVDAVISGFWHTHYPTAYFEFYGNRISPSMGRLLRRAGWALARQTYDFYDATFAAADCIVDDLRQQGIERVIQCPLGTDTERFHPRNVDPELRRRVGASDRPLVFFPHRLLREKGIIEVVEAVPRIAEATGAVFAFAGIGPERPRVEQLCAERDDCHHLGFIDSMDELARWYATADLSYGLSAWETFGLSVVESMASGLPLVGADRGAARDWIERSGCGRTVPHGDTEALVEATVELLQRPDLKEIGMRGRRFAVEHFAWSRTFDRMVDHYRRLVEARRSGRSLDGFPYRLETGLLAATGERRERRAAGARLSRLA